MQGHASTHSAGLVYKWIQDHGIPVMEWRPSLPDLNPIEHAWARLKDTIYKLDPDLENTRGSSEEGWKRCRGLIEQAWEALGDDYFDRPVRSMNSRVTTVLEANGRYTRYGLASNTTLFE